MGFFNKIDDKEEHVIEAKFARLAGLEKGFSNNEFKLEEYNATLADPKQAVSG